MPRKAASAAKAAAAPELRSTRSSQRKRQDVAEEVDDTSRSGAATSKRRRTEPHPARTETGNSDSGSVDDADEDELADPVPVSPATPSRRGRSVKGSAASARLNGVNGSASTPKGVHSTAKAKLETPTGVRTADGSATPRRVTVADRSARRKSARALIDRVLGDALSDDEAGDEYLAREIYESGEDEDEEEQQQVEEIEDALEEDIEEEAVAPTPSKRGRKKKVTTRKRSPTPPRDLPPHEMYFFQNKPGLPKTSTNTLASLELLTHDEYFSILRDLPDPHKADIQFLLDLHAESFNQWAFELAEGFSVCLYGYGSKRTLLHRFAKHLHSNIQDHHSHKIVVINGYVRATTIREVLTTIGSAADPSAKLTTAQPVVLLQDVLGLLTTSNTIITVFLNSADAPPLRKPQFQAILSQLAAHPHVHLACSVDTPDFTALWDSGQRSSLNFAFHDATTFLPRSAAELEVVDEVHELLGRRARRVGGKDGVAFVLKSLPDNAKNLFKLLVGEILVAMEEDGTAGTENPGVEYRMLYNKAVEEFICSSEMAFRTLLKE